MTLFRPSRPPTPDALDRAIAAELGLIRYWPLAEPAGGSAMDIVTGALASATGTASRPAEYGMARNFNGTSDWISAPASATVAGLPAVTVSAWIRAASGATNSIIYVERTSDPGNSGLARLLLYINAAGQLQLAGRNAIQDPTGTFTVFAAGTAIPTARWVHVAGVYSAAGCAVYSDGAVVGTGAGQSALGTTATAGIGIGGHGLIQYFSGQIGPVALFRRSLSAAEIKLLYDHPEILYRRQWREPGRKQRRSRVYVAPSAVTGSGALTEAPDLAAGSGGVTIQGSGAITEARDIITGAGGIVVTGSGAITEARDIVTGTSPGVVSGSGNIIEARDTVSGVGGIIVRGAGAITESRDIAAGGNVSAVARPLRLSLALAGPRLHLRRAGPRLSIALARSA